MAYVGEEKRTGVDEAGNRRRPGRPPGPSLSEEEEKRRREEKIIRDRLYRAEKTSQLKEYEEFCKDPEIAVKFKAFKQRKQEFKEALNQLEKVLMVLLSVPYFLPSSYHAPFLFRVLI
ncbi:hypothetical protein SLEP1_g59330 [Rubroshorea leprosula]|uniref:Uncharacterized protein n=1 Tax=Rubroshorea leprosula TaxID=152421 RepID=A0AAV5MV74_9ROSI|nr:hypothetical protein SLEP1_g59330 [Rubroshorea leprosula]